ncbi:MAG: PilZ domain-containing protein [Betaproteobacteria bacterium]|nr:MAG: PilZ domain-containing protein [Betaproteobacteria bacterium]
MESKKPETNRRVTPRKVLRRAAIVTPPDGVERSVSTWDLGLDGMSVLSSRPISPGTKCMVRFEVPLRGSAVDVSAQVKSVYCSFMGADGFKVGMVFIHLDASSATAISDFAS